MSHVADHHEEEQIVVPKTAIRAAFALIVLTILLAGFGKMTGIGNVRGDRAVAAQSVSVRFEDRADGAIKVVSPANGDILDVVEAGNDGFVRTVLRGMAYERRRRAIDSGPAFTINRWADGHLTLDDPATGRSVDLAPFGTINMRRFVSLLDKGGAR